MLGIDPGSVRTGYGLIETDGVRSFHLQHGHWALAEAAASDEFSIRLGRLYQLLEQFISEHEPDVVAVEQVFMSQNAQSALKLGQARGAALAAAVNGGVPVFEYAPRTVKQAVTGTGSADKSQVGKMIQRLLHLEKIPQNDAADALAVAVCHAHTGSNNAKRDSGAGSGTRRRSKRWRSLPGGVNGVSSS